jgi:hypothetical protein
VPYFYDEALDQENEDISDQVIHIISATLPTFPAEVPVALIQPLMSFSPCISF